MRLQQAAAKPECRCQGSDERGVSAKILRSEERPSNAAIGFCSGLRGTPRMVGECMAKLRIGVLYDFWWDEDETREDDESRPKRKTPDEDIQEVYDALKTAGHNPVYLRLDRTT